MPIFIGFAAVVGLFALFVSTRAAAFRIERSRTIAAPPATLFGLINDLHAWVAWSPWEKMDAGMTKTYGGAPAGKGATYRWVGNKKVGEGAMTILDSAPDARVEIKLEFIKPFAATNITTFTLEPAGDATRVTWAMDGQKNFMSKAFGVFVNMDQLVGRDFDRGLEAMETAAARPA